MRTRLLALLLLAAPSLLRAADAAPALEWNVAEGRDVPGPVKQALIAESEKLSSGEEIAGFTFYRTAFDAKEQHFKAVFHAAGKVWTVVCKPDGAIESSEAKAADGPAPGPAVNPTPGPKAPEP